MSEDSIRHLSITKKDGVKGDKGDIETLALEAGTYEIVIWTWQELFPTFRCEVQSIEISGVKFVRKTNEWITPL